MSLPLDWIIKTVGEIYEVVGGGTPSTAVEEYWFGEIPWITSADIHGLKEIRPRRKITREAIEHSATNLIPAGTIIVVTRVSLGKVALTPFPLCFSQDSQALLPKTESLRPDYALYYFSQATQVFKYQSRGTTISGVTKKQLKDLPIPIPPPAEQERIVARIESLFTQLDAGVAGLKRVQAALKRYRASVLKAACEGRLVPQDPADEPAGELLKRILAEKGEKAGKVPAPDGDLPELPKGWVWARWEQLISLAQNGFGKRKSDTGVPTIVLRLADIVDNKISLDNVRQIGATDEDVRKYKLEKQDLICIRVNGSLDYVGRLIVFHDAPETVTFCDHFIRFRMVVSEMATFYSIYFDTDRARKFIELNRVSSAGQNTISQGKLFNFTVPLPPLHEQLRIVAEVEQRLSVVQEVEAAVSAGLRRAARLRQAILKRAFEGRLV